MRRLCLALLASIAVCVASAQMTEAIWIDISSFKAVNSDAISGINIDPINLDSSRHACARIKMRVERMTRQDIDGLEVRLRTNNELTKCKTAEYDNGLIIEMTAKPNSRFYLHHDKFGDSNEVTLKLEGNKEYYIEASLNQQYSITVASNVADADVYIGNVFKGKTNADGYLIVEDMLAGEHTLTIDYAGTKYREQIVVSSSNVFFKLDVDVAASKPQYLIIKTTPKSALVEINGVVVENSADGASKLIQPGVFQYTVTAQNFHTKSGQGVMRGEQITLEVALEPAFGYLAVEADKELDGAQVYVDNTQRGVLPLSKDIVLKSGEHNVRIVKSMYNSMERTVTITDGKKTDIEVTLVPNFSEVTLRTKDGAEIWVDNVKKGAGVWQGRLEIGEHIVECRKESYRTATHTLSVKSSAAIDRTFEPLKAICGVVDITSSPIGATITIDGTVVGKTPLMKSDVLVGKRQITISKEGYNSETETVEVKEGVVHTVKSTLTKKSTSTISKPATVSTPKQKVKGKQQNIFQVAVGLEYGFGGKQMTLGVPVDLRIGRYDQLFNLFITGRYGYKSSTLKDEDDLDFKPEITVNQWSLGGNVRVNFLRDVKSSGYTLFANLGALYNFNTKATYKTGSIAYNSSSFDSGIDSYTEYECDIVNKTSLSGLLAIGLGGRLMEFSLYAFYDITPTYHNRSLSQYITVHSGNNQPQTLADYPDLNRVLDSRFNIGISCKVFLGSGFAK